MSKSNRHTNKCFNGLPQISGGWMTARHTLCGHSFLVTQPACPDMLLADVIDRQTDSCDQDAPYWAHLWPAAFKMASLILQWSQGDLPMPQHAPSFFSANERAIELGTGIGLVGLAAQAAGLDVTLTDYDPQAVQLAVFNARQNGFHNVKGVTLDWRSPATERYTFVFGCDITYEIENHEPLLHLLREILAEDGLCWIGDPGRNYSQAFYERATLHGFHVRILGETGELYDTPEVGRFQVYQLQSPTSCP